MSYKILSINPGSTSTKVAFYVGKKLVFSESITHSDEELRRYDEILDQLPFRKKAVDEVLQTYREELSGLDLIMSRGGLLPYVQSGAYLITKEMTDAIRNGYASPHASNLGALIAEEIAATFKIPAYIYDAVTSDEFSIIATITGLPEIRRESMCHVLNIKATAHKLAKKYNKNFKKLKLIVAHLGGGISIGVLENGKIIDAIRDDAGPFSPERSGMIPLLYIIDMCYSGEYTKTQMIKLIRGMGGLKAYLGTSDAQKIEEMILEGNEKAKILYTAQAYQIAKGIGELAPVVNGKVDYIILTGGMAHSAMMTEMIKKRVEFIAPVELFPGENEMEALTMGGLRILRKEEEPKMYKLLDQKTMDETNPHLAMLNKLGLTRESDGI
ncbi:MAG: butyrate kinase [Eubacteriales bacterium]|nr:butyrate kinase [Eubacteriales bacterium]MDD3349857.1 butyrate kinase [Eubacteriales bacterium]